MKLLPAAFNVSKSSQFVSCLIAPKFWVKLQLQNLILKFFTFAEIERGIFLMMPSVMT